jgi:hypothetical protein
VSRSMFRRGALGLINTIRSNYHAHETLGIGNAVRSLWPLSSERKTLGRQASSASCCTQREEIDSQISGQTGDNPLLSVPGATVCLISVDTFLAPAS